MILWGILFLVAMLIGIPFFKGEDKLSIYTYAAAAIVVCGVISIITSACAPNQFKPDDNTMFSRTICDEIVITPETNGSTQYNTDNLNLSYKIAGSDVSLTEEVKLYCSEICVSETGYPYFERYFCDYLSPVRSFLYQSWCRPRWYYKIYICEHKNE